MSELLTIEPNSWPGFRGLFIKDDLFRYVINDRIHKARNLLLAGRRLSNREIMEYSLDYILDNDEYQQCPSFTIDTSGSEILVLYMGINSMLYQQLSNGQFIELLPRQSQYQEILDVFTIQIPLPGGIEENNKLPRLDLRKIDLSMIIDFINNQTTERSDLDQILRILNPSQKINEFQQSYEALLKQLYNLHNNFI